jgi:hypothetical protein
MFDNSHQSVFASIFLCVITFLAVQAPSHVGLNRCGNIRQTNEGRVIAITAGMAIARYSHCKERLYAYNRNRDISWDRDISCSVLL